AQRQCLSRNLGRFSVGFKEPHAVRAVAQVGREEPPLFIGQRAAQEVEAVVHDFLAREKPQFVVSRLHVVAFPRASLVRIYPTRPSPYPKQKEWPKALVMSSSGKRRHVESSGVTLTGSWPRMTAQGQWQPFSVDALPLLPADSVRWTAALARAQSRVPLAVTIAAKGVGAVEIGPAQLAFARAGDEVDLDGLDTFRLQRDGQLGCVGVGHRVSLAMVRAVLGGPAPTAIRPLGRSERGVMAAILLSALDTLGVSRRIEIGLVDWEGRPDPTNPCLVIGGSIRTSGHVGGRALLVIPVGW